VSFPVAPLESVDYMKWNLLFNRLMLHRERPGDDENNRLIGELARSFSFGTTLSLRTAARPWGAPEYTFSSPVTKRTVRGDVTAFFFEEHEKVLGLPLVRIEAKIPVKPFSVFKPAEAVKGLTGKTPHWPVGHEKVNQIVEDLLNEDRSGRESLERLHEWVVTHIDFTNKIIGIFSQVETIEVTFYQPNDARIPAVETSLRLEPFGNPVSADGATAGHRYWLRNVTFQDGTRTVSDQEGTLNFFFDTGTNLTIVNNAIAARLGLASKPASFDCFRGQQNGYYIDSVTMAGTRGDYRINNVSICVKEDTITVGDAVIGTNFFDRVQIVIDGPHRGQLDRCV